jgi:hypothetical protein
MMHVSVIQAARASLLAQGLFTRHPGSSEYQLDIDTLHDRQSGVELRQRVPIYHLVDYGLPIAIINRLVDRDGLRTVEELDRRLAGWRKKLDCDGTAESLATYLDIPMLGKGKCGLIMAAVASWNMDHNE